MKKSIVGKLDRICCQLETLQVEIGRVEISAILDSRSAAARQCKEAVADAKIQLMKALRIAEENQ